MNQEECWRKYWTVKPALFLWIFEACPCTTIYIFRPVRRSQIQRQGSKSTKMFIRKSGSVKGLVISNASASPYYFIASFQICVTNVYRLTVDIHICVTNVYRSTVDPCLWNSYCPLIIFYELTVFGGGAFFL